MNSSSNLDCSSLLASHLLFLFCLSIQMDFCISGHFNRLIQYGSNGFVDNILIISCCVKTEELLINCGG